MSTRRWVAVPAALALLLAAPEAPASDFSFAWIQTSSALPPLNGVPRLASGDTAVLEVRVHADSDGVWGASISVEYDPTLLRVVGYERCPPGPGNEFGGMGACATSQGPLGFAGLLPVSTALPLVVDNELGRSGVFAAECGGTCGVYDWTFELVHVVFEVLAPPGFAPPLATEVTHYYEPGLGGIGSNAGSPGVLSLPDVAPAPLLVVPTPPGVPALSGAGIRWLGALLAAAGVVLAARPARG